MGAFPSAEVMSFTVSACLFALARSSGVWPVSVFALMVAPCRAAGWPVSTSPYAEKSAVCSGDLSVGFLAVL